MMPTARPFPPPAVIAPAALAAAVAHPTSAAVQAVAIELVSALERSRRSPRLRTEQLIDGLRCARAALEAHAHEATVVVAVCELYEESLQAHADEGAGMFTAERSGPSQRSSLGGQSADEAWMQGRVLEETRPMLPLLFRALQHEHGDEGTWVEVAERALSLLSAHALARSWLPGVSVGCCPSHSLVAWPRAPRPMQSRTGASSRQGERQVLAQHTTL